MASENCPKCGTPMEVVKNKNRGYFAQCPNKASHGAGVPAAAEKKLAKETPKPENKPEIIKPHVTGKTLFGW